MAARANADSGHGWGDVAAVAWETVQALGRRLRRPPDLSWMRWVAGAVAYVFALSVLLVALQHNPRVGFWALYYLVGLAALLAGAAPCRDDHRHLLTWAWAIVGGVVQTAAHGRHETGAWAGVGFWVAIAGTLWPAPLGSVVAVIDAAGVWAAAGFALLLAWSAITNVSLNLLGAHLLHPGLGHTLLPGTAGVATAVLAGAAAWYALRTARLLRDHVERGVTSVPMPHGRERRSPELGPRGLAAWLHLIVWAFMIVPWGVLVVFHPVQDSRMFWRVVTRPASSGAAVTDWLTQSYGHVFPIWFRARPQPFQTRSVLTGRAAASSGTGRQLSGGVSRIPIKCRPPGRRC